jgi:hypothetical protein
MDIPKLPTLHITRREHWSDKKHYNRISLLEWKLYVNTDPELKMINEVRFRFQGELFIIRDEGLSTWTPYKNLFAYSQKVHFHHDNGNIDVIEPDQRTIRKMIEIALKLDAKVQDDEGEYYTEKDFPPVEAEKPWKFW